MAQESQKIIFECLTEEQQQAVLATEGPVLIIAGAGSGKTRTLTHRLAHILSKGVNPGAVVALTFTNKAADEMARRTEQLLQDAGIRAKGMPFVGTFHSLSARILRTEISRLGWPRSFSIYDEDDRLALVKDALKDLGIPKEKISPGLAVAVISRLKNEMLGSEELEKERAESSRLLAKVFTYYHALLKKRAALDFDDLLLKVLEVFGASPETLVKYQRKFRYVLVDEYQDTNKPQFLFIRALGGTRQNVCVCGDDWQAIYRFRGADFRNILNFQRDWPDAQVFFLEENFRSTQTILDASHGIIAKNQFRTEKKLYTRNEKGAPIFLTRLRNEFEEAEYVAEKIKEKFRAGKSLADFCVLFRTNAQSRALEESFIVREIPYQLIGGFKFYRRREIQDIIAYLRLIYNPRDLAALERAISVPPRGIGKVSIERIKQGDQAVFTTHKAGRLFFSLIQKGNQMKGKEPVLALLKWLLAEIRYQVYLNPNTYEGLQRWENVEEFMNLARSFDDLEPPRGLEELLQSVALIQEADEYEPRSSKVTLMTLHSAKGLEFPVVFIVGCEEGILPHEKSLHALEDMEEERRLIYVGMTRAKEEVYLAFTHHRLRRGAYEKNPPSRFLGDIPEAHALFIDQYMFSNDDDAIKLE